MDIKLEVYVHAPEIKAAVLALTQELKNYSKTFDAKSDDEFLKVLREEGVKKLFEYSRKCAMEDKGGEKVEGCGLEGEKSGEDNAHRDISFEEIRNRLINIARDGQGERIKELIKSFGANKLSEIPKEEYGKILAEIEKWQDKRDFNY